MKYILIIGDGMADNPVPELDGRTPLEAAQKPHIDAVAAKSVLGSVLTVPVHQPPGSDTAILSIFGCDPNRYFTGRSPLEAAGSGIRVNPGAVSYRCNMVTLEDGVAQVLALKEQGMRLKDAAKEVAEHTGLSKNELYAAALER